MASKLVESVWEAINEGQTSVQILDEVARAIFRPETIDPDYDLNRCDACGSRKPHDATKCVGYPEGA